VFLLILDSLLTAMSTSVASEKKIRVLPAGSSFLASKNLPEMSSIMTIAMPLHIPVILHVAKMMEALAAKKPMYTWVAALRGSQWYP
jgi:hypothetical protein